MRRRKEAGQALVLTAFALTLLTTAAGLGVDMGYLRYQKRLQQSAADSAAIAGASDIPYNNVITAAKTDSASNGYTDGSNNVTVTVSNPPSDGPHAGTAGYVEVLVRKTQPTFFMRIVGVRSAPVIARAVAYLSGNAKSCMYAIGTGGGNGILNNGTGSISAPNCGIIDNQSLLNNGTGTITASSIGVVGSVTNNGTGSITPTPVTGIVPASDPLAYLQPPTPGTCLPGNPGNLNGGGSATLSQGNYCSGISVNGSINVTLNPGLYTITGGGISFNGTGTITGTGVTLYIGSSGGSVSLNGTDTFNLTAPTTGTYAGILFYQDPGDTSGATINGTISSRFQGATYFPSAQLTLNGTGSTSAYFISVAKSYVLNGTGTLNCPSNFSSLPGGSPIKDAILVE
jgi:hypothetical protein